MTTETTEHDEAPFARGGTLARAETLFNAWAHIRPRERIGAPP